MAAEIAFILNKILQLTIIRADPMTAQNKHSLENEDGSQLVVGHFAQRELAETVAA